jgi:5-methylcytosine-specific restriction endonuclease McrA
MLPTYFQLPSVKPTIGKNKKKPSEKQPEKSYVTIEQFNQMCKEFNKKIGDLTETIDKQQQKLDELERQQLKIDELEKNIGEEPMAIDTDISNTVEENTKTPYLRFRSENIETFKNMARQKNPDIKDNRKLYQISTDIAKQTWKLMSKTQQSKYGAVETRQHIPKPLKLNLWNVHFSPERAYGLCYICSNQIHISNFEAGHVHPVARGGKNTLENLRPICGTCNKSMGAKNLYDFKNQYFGI